MRYRVAAKTMDDAAGEAFDKGARLLGLGYPGGKELDQLAARGDPGFARFPRAVPRGLGFSSSGLKTALLYDLKARDAAEIEEHRADIAASYQAAIVRQLVEKTVAGAEHEGLRRVAVAGGVAANSGLRRVLTEACDAEGLQLSLPPLSLCTDNAGMIGLAAGFLPALPGRTTSAWTRSPATPRPRRRARHASAPPAAPDRPGAPATRSRPASRSPVRPNRLDTTGPRTRAFVPGC